MIYDEIRWKTPRCRRDTICRIGIVFPQLTACFVMPLAPAHLSSSLNICAHGPSLSLSGCLCCASAATAAVAVRLFEASAASAASAPGTASCFDEDCPIFNSFTDRVLECALDCLGNRSVRLEATGYAPAYHRRCLWLMAWVKWTVHRYLVVCPSLNGGILQLLNCNQRVAT